MASLSGNAWGGGKGKAAGGGNQAAQSAPAPVHVSVKDFNSAEVQDFLKKSKSINLLFYYMSITSLYFIYDERSPVAD